MSGTSDAEHVDRGLGSIQRITWIGSFVNLALTAVKVGVGAAVGSIGLIADGVHSFFDLITDMVVIVSTRIGARPPDEDHPWGHGKLETVGALVISVVFCVAGFEVIRGSITSLAHGESRFPGLMALNVAALSLLAKEILFHVTKRVATATGSRTLMANAWHHRSDALSSLAVIVGVGATLLGMGRGDMFAGIAVGLLILAAGFRFMWDSLSELVERSAGPEIVAIIGRAVDSVETIRTWHRVRSRYVGRELYIDLHVEVPRTYTVVEADHVAHVVEGRIRENLPVASNIIVHVDPEARSGGTGTGS